MRGSELPARMLAVSHAAWGLQTLRVWRVAGGVEGLAVLVADSQDHPGRGHHAAVAEGAERRDHVDDAHLGGADGDRQPGVADGATVAADELEAGLGDVRVERLVAEPGQGPDGRDVERLLERVPGEHGAVR